LAPSPEQHVRSVHRSKSKRAHARRKKTDEPVNLLAYLRKLVTPETKPRPRKRRAQARR
jgi:hypothetical protein